MKNYRKISNVLYIVAALCYITSIWNICNKNSQHGIMWLGIGSTFLCLGSINAMNANKKGEKNGKDIK